MRDKGLNDGDFAKHKQKVKEEIVQIMTDLYPKAIIPEALFTRTKLARSLLEVTMTVRTLCGEGMVKMSEASENAYLLAQAPPGHRARASKRGSGSSASKFDAAVLEFLRMNGPALKHHIQKAVGCSNATLVVDRLVDLGKVKHVQWDGPRKLYDLVTDKNRDIPPPEALPKPAPARKPEPARQAAPAPAPASARPQEQAPAIEVGVGMPAALYLDDFGGKVWEAFGAVAYLVGSAFRGKAWRDVDVRVLIDDEEYAGMGLGDPGRGNAKWAALCLAFSELGRQMTGLPIDFQIQQRSHANDAHGGPRQPLIAPFMRAEGGKNGNH